MRRILFEGHAIDSGQVRRDLYRLLSYLIAEPELESEWPEYDRGLGSGLREAEICQCLIRVAVYVRTRQDGTKRVEADSAVCGQLLGPATSTDGPELGADRDISPLTLREACNKIVHAKTVCLGVDGSQSSAKKRVPRLMLVGSKDSADWTVDVDLVAFAHAVIRRLG